jgi:DNA-binding NarL/FixJ family response regulator
VSHARALVAVAAELQPRVIEALDGWNLLFCADGEEAIDHLWDGSPDAIILDFDLPRMTAYDVVRHLAMRRPELVARTVVLIDGEHYVQSLIQGVAVGRCLSKPIAVSSLSEAVRGLA